MADLVEKYVYEIGQNLPKKNRADIEAEIRSLIQDTLESRSQSAGTPVDEAMMVEVLNEFGSPERMAESYQPARYLIGPRLFPSFILVIRTVIAIILVLALVRFGVTLGTSPTVVTAKDALVALFTNLITTAFSLLGSVVIIFGILEWFLAKKPKIQSAEAWDPRKLKGETQEGRVQPAELVAGIVFTIVAIVIFNFFPNIIGISYNGTEWIGTPALNDVFFGYMPLINVVWGLSIVKDLVLLRSGFQTTFTRWFSIVINILTISVAVIILQGPSILNPAVLSNLVSSETFRDILNGVVDGILVIIIINEGWNLARTIYRLFVKKVPVLVIKDE